MKIELESRQVDNKRRLIMPRSCPPRAAVTIQEIDRDTWLVKRHRPVKDAVKVVLVPSLDKLPADPAWDQVEVAFAAAASRKLSPPEP